MPRNVTHLDIFVASPSDLESERQLFEKVCNELNITLGRHHGIYLDLIRWETHTFPDFDIEPQAVINKQIGNSYDVFIGMLWGRFGTPTQGYSSGTEEEYQRALKRFRDNPDSLHLTFYFKDEPIPPSKIEPEQIAAIQRFKASIPVDGGLYGNFRTLDELASFVRLHLSQIIINYSKSLKPLEVTIAPVANNNLEPAETEDAPEDVGFFDAIAESTDFFDRHVTALDEFNNTTTNHSELLASSAVKLKSPDIDLVQRRRILDTMASNLLEYAQVLKNSKEPVFSPLHKAISRTTTAVYLASDFTDENVDGLQDLLRLSQNLIDTYSGVIESCTGAATSIESMPRLTTKLSKAKREVVEGLMDCAQAFEYAQNLLRNLLITIEKAQNRQV